MKQVFAYACSYCHRLHNTPGDALDCEVDCRRQKERAEKAQAEVKQTEQHWRDQGHDVWYEYSGLCHAPLVDPVKFGPHDFPDDDGTSDCRYGCGCWMGPARSGGPFNPFGACPKNPKPPPQETQEKERVRQG